MKAAPKASRGVPVGREINRAAARAGIVHRDVTPDGAGPTPAAPRGRIDWDAFQAEIEAEQQLELERCVDRLEHAAAVVAPGVGHSPSIRRAVELRAAADVAMEAAVRLRAVASRFEALELAERRLGGAS